MKFRRLGRTELLVSEIGLGTAQIGGPSHIDGRYVGMPKILRSEAVKILNQAFDYGVNLFDTSDKYGDGESERLLGEVFSRRRDQVLLATKCGITANGDRCFEKDYVKNCLEQSLRNLRVDCIDIFQFTKPDISVIVSGEIYELFDELKREGKIRFSGVSTGSTEEIIKLIGDKNVDVLQIFYNLLHTEPNMLFIGQAFQAGIGLMVRSPLSSGILTGKYGKNAKFPEEDYRSSFLTGETLSSRVKMVERIRERFCLKENVQLLEFSLNFLLSNDKISTVLVGVSHADQLVDIMRVSTANRMNAEEVCEVEDYIRSNF